MRLTSPVQIVIILFFCLTFEQVAQADCFDNAAAYHHVNPEVLRAIAWIESHNQPDSRHLNLNGTSDYGLMQINSIHLNMLSGFHIGVDELMQPCKNIYIAAWYLRRQMDRYGNTWEAIGSYHSSTPQLRDAYARQIASVLRHWRRIEDNKFAKDPPSR
jgi:soluble lytic murein transglycosylase-like protein